MLEIFINNESVHICENINEAHTWLINEGVTDDDQFHVQDIETGEIVSQTPFVILHGADKYDAANYL